MTDAEALSLLVAMDTEENTLRPLWDQFTVARRRVGEVITHYKDISGKVPELEQRKMDLELEITHLESDRNKRKDEVFNEVTAYRKSLEDELVTIEKDIHNGREKVVGLQGAIREAENRRDAKQVEMDASLVELTEKLNSKQREWDEFRQGVLR